ncbi:ABC transporter permease [Clostridium sp. UBA7503]|uniref:ABC transporter permease n=1 Tax=Clostridium sp. UBA7503 TaxID=1946377 RepID=UPI0032162A50
MMESIERFFQQSLYSFKALFAWVDAKVYFLVKILNPILQLLFFCLLAKYCYNAKDLTQWVVGNSFLLCVYNCLFGIGNVFCVERYFGTLKMIIASPANKFITFFERGFVHILDSCFTVTIGLIAGGLIFNIDFHNVNIPVLIFVTVIAMFSAVGFGLFIGSFGMVASNMNLIMNILSMVLLALSGANIPLEYFPVTIQKISYCLPITRSIQAANLAMKNQEISKIIHLMGEEILLGIIYIILGYTFMILMEKVAQKRASFDIY